MSIAEIINERGEVTRINYWNDNFVRVVKSHTYSIMYMLKYQEIQRYLEYNQIIFQSRSLADETQKRTMEWIKNYQRDREEDVKYKSEV